MKVLITGGAGFLGLHLARYFHQKKWQVSLIDIATFPKEEYRADFKLISADIRNKFALDKAIKGMDVVVHAAAALPLWSRADIMGTNVEGTKNVLESSRKHQVKKVVYISSTAVYGVPKKHPILETDPRVGMGAYGESKIAAENLCLKAIKSGLNVTILRPKTFVGTERLGVFEILFDWIHDGKKIPMIGNGQNKYQLFDVDDLVDAIYLCAQSQDKSLNDYFNVASDNFSTVANDLGALFQHAGTGSRLLTFPATPIKIALQLFEKLGISPLYQWVYDTADKDSYVSIEKIKKALKWQPKYSGAQALIRSYDWYEQHYQEIKSRGSGVTHTVGWKQGVLGIIKKFL
ncbi:MAG: NAD(P)-dependent oxidoreductase [Patescibacteria group bacterium]